MARSFEAEFQQLCHDKHLAATHQRLVLYRALMQMPDHPNPEQVYERVRTELPSISLGTVYKTLHLFLEAGIIREVSPHHGSLRIEPNTGHHNHFLCLRCHSITDLDVDEIDVSPLEDAVPAGFRIAEVALEVRGLCSQCAVSAADADA
jgi:Fur family peroxide stress response transcriptional regulator